MIYGIGIVVKHPSAATNTGHLERTVYIALRIAPAVGKIQRHTAVYFECEGRPVLECSFRPPDRILRRIGYNPVVQPELRNGIVASQRGNALCRRLLVRDRTRS